ncbi:MAG: CoA transferase, partial [Deltaproteobacteria bacterium]|nr:CoA transferase [Deltaproteobacteria bacterium]
MPGLHAMQEREGLSGLRVVEVGRSPAAAMAGKVLADLGASVVKVEPPDGDPLRSWGPISGSEPPLEPAPMFFHLNAGKRSLVLDLSQPAGVSALVEASAACELLVHDFPPALMPGLGLDYARLSKRNPALVMASITPFGLSGPYRDYQASELTLIHGGGLGWLCPDATPPPERPPLRPFGHHAHLQAGLHAALTGLALVRSARISGQGDHVDLSIMAAVAGQLGRHFASATYPGVEETRLGRNVTAPATYFPCKDGVLYLIAVEQDQWNRLMEFMGSPEWSHSERFGSTLLRG